MADCCPGRGRGSIFNQKIIMSDGGVGGGNEITFELCGCGEGEKGGG